MHREKVMLDGVQIPSVTQVLAVVRKPFLEIWRGKLGNQECDRILQESQELGHRLHDAIECYFKAETMPELPEREAQMFALFKGWAMENKFSPLELELSLTSSKYGYHGTTDAIGTVNGQLVIADWKTSSGMDEFHGCQLSAYAEAYRELTGTVIDKGVIVRIDKKEKAKKPLEVKYYLNLPEYFKVFQACKLIWDFQNTRKNTR